MTESAEPANAQARDSRWRLDSWLMWRQQSVPFVAQATARPASYGASQAGAILRYRLDRNGKNDPEIFVRGSQALISGGESELAVGFGLKPIADIPLRARAELRVTDTAAATTVRPAAMVISELPPQRLPGGFEAEVYGQAGYVAGDFATPFADAQLRIDRPVADFRGAQFRLGAGAWAGAQKGASRLDVGPAASIRTEIVNVPLRVSIDYRVRVAGDAVPDSGLAITLSSGF